MVHQGQSGAANFVSTPEPLLNANLERAIKGCPEPTHACGCFAGLLTAQDIEQVKSLLQTLCPNAAIRAEPDYAAALAASLPGTDICVIAGTGALVCSNFEGRVVKSGGRGFVLGDYGSAYRYGREFLRYHLEQGSLVEIAGELKPIFGSVSEPEIVSNLYRTGPIAPKLAQLAAAFAKAAKRGETYSLEFLSSETERLAGLVITHANRWHPQKLDVEVSLAGGLWKISPIYETVFIERLREVSGGRKVNVRRISRAPVEGAVILAKELLYEHGI